MDSVPSVWVPDFIVTCSRVTSSSICLLKEIITKKSLEKIHRQIMFLHEYNFMLFSFLKSVTFQCQIVLVRVGSSMVEIALAPPPHTHTSAPPTLAGSFISCITPTAAHPSRLSGSQQEHSEAEEQDSWDYSDYAHLYVLYDPSEPVPK
jgi:hypothetical protein